MAKKTTSAGQKTDTEIKNTAKTGEEVTQKPFLAKDIDPTQYIIVRNGFQGRLVYKSQRTGEHFVWDEFGSEQEVELRELKNAKNSHKKFFINNWFMFDEDWIVDYLGVGMYYKHAIKIEDFDDIFKKSPSEIKKIISGMSNGQKKSIAYRAKTLITEKEIDSLKIIDALEESLGVDLIEK